MKIRSMMLIAAALGLGFATTAAWAQQKAPTNQSESAEKAEPKNDERKEGEEKKNRDADGKAHKDTANARAAARNAKQGKELEEEQIPQQ